MSENYKKCPSALIALELMFAEMEKDEVSCTCGSEEGDGCYIHDGQELVSRLKITGTAAPLPWLMSWRGDGSLWPLALKAPAVTRMFSVTMI